MPLPEAHPSTATSQPCKNKYGLGVVIQKIKYILNWMATVTFPIAINKGGTGGITIAAARLAFKLPTVDLDVATAIDCAVSTNFFNAIAANKSYTLVNMADGLSIQLLIQNTSGGTITPSLPAGVKWIGGSDPGTIAAGEYGLYSLTSINSIIVGAIGNPVT